MLINALVNALFSGLFLFLALELHYKVVKVRESNGGRVPLRDLARPIADLTEDQKAQFVDAFDEEEYEDHLNGGGRSQLLAKLKDLAPWNSKGNKSQSSDS